MHTVTVGADEARADPPPPPAFSGNMIRWLPPRSIRPMRPEDAGAVYDTASTALFESMEEREVLRRRTPEQVEARKARYEHSLRHDPGGPGWPRKTGASPAWRRRGAGVAISARRERVWVLSLLAVDAAHRGTGLSRELLGRAVAYGEGCEGAMIASARHPAAMRSYARAGFDLHPTLSASGTVRREAIATGLDVREGEERDLELAAGVDRAVRGAAHGPDLEHMLSTGSRLLVAERPSGMGYVAEHNGSPAVLAATDPAAARDLLWACLERIRRARRRTSTGSRAARTGQCLSRSKPASPSPPPVPSAREEISAP